MATRSSASRDEGGAADAHGGGARGVFSFVLATAFLNTVGLGLIAPVLNFITGPYTTRASQGMVVAALFTVYSLAQFLAAPTLGALSDRLGRRPILLASLVGSAAGYLLLGIGGALWVLFAGRVVDGLTGGNISTIYAYVADRTEPDDRAKSFGTLGAASGLGFVMGPVIGAALHAVTGSVALLMYVAALLSLLNAVWGYLVMPESLAEEDRARGIDRARLSPLRQLTEILSATHLRILIASVLLWTCAFSVLQSNLAFFTEDRLGWTASDAMLLFVLAGLVGVLTQGVLVRRLLQRYGEARLAVGGLLLMAGGFAVVAATAVTGASPLVGVAVVCVGMGNGLTIPSTTSLLSRAVGRQEQGRIQGGNQSVQSLGRILGPLLGGGVYAVLGAAATYLTGAALLAAAAVTVAAGARALVRTRPAP